MTASCIHLASSDEEQRKAPWLRGQSLILEILNSGTLFECSASQRTSACPRPSAFHPHLVSTDNGRWHTCNFRSTTLGRASCHNNTADARGSPVDHSICSAGRRIVAIGNAISCSPRADGRSRRTHPKPRRQGGSVCARASTEAPFDKHHRDMPYSAARAA